jgi:hypothetical protein
MQHEDAQNDLEQSTALIDLQVAASSLKPNSSPRLMLPAFSLPFSQKCFAGVDSLSQI